MKDSKAISVVLEEDYVGRGAEDGLEAGMMRLERGNTRIARVCHYEMAAL